ncbi:PepSY domain-containing protein [Nocardioides nanhaiensis]|uniref:PepSY domain-containing protein n=1 Tax=Nocardioides nanhaiensis TaxID=1476871 RepID=A0ABP8X437_9ACTN
MNARRPARLLAAASLPLVLALSACGSDDDDRDDTTALAPSASAADGDTATPTPSEAPTSAAPSTAPTQAPSSGGSAAGSSDDEAALAAARTALDAAGGTVVTVDTDRGGWEVVVAAADGSETEVGLDAAGTAVTRGPQPEDRDEDAEDRAETQRAVQAARVSYADALATARGVVSGKPLDSVDLSEDDGRITWDVQFGDGAAEQTVVINAGSGQVLGTERDD